MEKPEEPSQLFTDKDLFTLHGAAAAVWVTCLVASNLIPANVNNAFLMRMIALCVSIVLSVAILIKDKQFDLQHYLLTFFNSLLIFANASGFNALSTGLSFDSKTDLKSPQATLSAPFEIKKASFFPFNKEINWWPDRRLIAETRRLKDSLALLQSDTAQVKAIPPGAGTNALKRDLKAVYQQNMDLRQQLQLCNAKLMAVPAQGQTPNPGTNPYVSRMAFLENQLGRANRINDSLKKVIARYTATKSERTIP